MGPAVMLILCLLRITTLQHIVFPILPSEQLRQKEVFVQSLYKVSESADKRTGIGIQI